MCASRRGWGPTRSFASGNPAPRADTVISAFLEVSRTRDTVLQRQSHHGGRSRGSSLRGLRWTEAAARESS